MSYTPYKGSSSLINLLKDILINADKLNLKWFISQYVKKDLMLEGQARHDYLRFSEKNKDKISNKKIERDIDKLMKSYRSKKIRHKIIAHKDRKNIKVTTSTNGIHKLIDLLDTVFCKYYLLIHQSTLKSTLSNTAEDIQIPEI